MFQKTPDHRAHADALGQPGHARRQHAGAAHDEVDACAVARGVDECPDQRGIGQGVDLHDDACRPARTRRRSHLCDVRQQPLVHHEGGRQQVAGRPHMGLAGQLQEHGVGVGGEAGVGGEHAHVGVQARRARVVVAGAQVQVAAQARHRRALVGGAVQAFAPRHQQHLAVRFQADDAVDHLRAHGLQPLGPVDVGFLVETRLQLHHRQHFLAAARGLDQQVHQHALGAGAVDGLLDRQHLGVVHGFAQELHHRLEALEGMVQQHVAMAQALEDRLLARQLQFGPAGFEARKTQRIGVGLVDELVQPHQVDRAVHLVQRQLGQAELLEQEVRQLRRARRHHFQPDGEPELARRQSGAQGLAQIGDVVLVDIDVAVTRDAELRKGLHRAAREQLAQVGADDAGEQHETLPPGAQRRRQRDHPRQHARHLDDGNQVLAPEGVAAAQPGDEIERLVGHQRKGVARVQAHRHQQRAHLGREEALHPGALGGVALGMVQHHDARALQRRHQHLVEQRVLLVDEFVRRAGHCRQVSAGDAGSGLARGLDDVGHAHLEELVQVAGDDGDVAQSFEQRHVLALGLCQHAPVELQDRTFAVQQLQHRRGQRGRRRARSCCRRGRVGHAASVRRACDRRVTASGRGLAARATAQAGAGGSAAFRRSTRGCRPARCAPAPS